jgi:hypothetical protein
MGLELQTTLASNAEEFTGLAEEHFWILGEWGI